MTSHLKAIKTIKELELKNKVIFLRLDLNVPLKDSNITDDTRIRSALPTIQYCIEKGGKLILASHLGRPKGQPEDRKKYSLEPVANYLAKITNYEVLLMEEPRTTTPKELLPSLKKNQIILLENLRFDEGEKKNDTHFAETLASFVDVYINDAFGSSHRAHASIAGIPKYVKEKAVGFLIEKEVKMLSKLIENPAKPFMAILGGAKISDKIDVIENLMNFVDTFVIGGGMAYTFLKAQGFSIGNSLLEKDKLKFAQEMLDRIKVREKNILLPIDHIVAQNLENSESKTTSDENIEDGWMGVDIGPKTIEKFRSAIIHAKTCFWNGPMGVFEKEAYSKGTFKIAEILAELSSTTTIVGGGDSASAANKSGHADKMTHISTGGGASLEFIQGKKLPGLEILREKN